MSDIDYQQMIKHYDAFKEIQNQQKARGLNDFNVFTTLLKSSDEVRLHSRFIGALLNKDGLHYQGTLFLDKFLDKFKPNNFDFDAQSSRCSIERENKIDIYLTDGINHIIIENKVYAGDQKNQIQRYIEHIKYKNKDIDGSNIWVIYLSLGRSEPSKYSLGKYTVDKTKLTHDEFSVHYSNIHYKQNSVESNKIMYWLDDCLKEIKNITNLFGAISSYKEVVEKLSGTYRSNVMGLTEYVKSIKPDHEKNHFIKSAIKFNKEFPTYRINVIQSFFEELYSNLKEINMPDGWGVEYNKNSLEKKYSFPLRIKKERNQIVIGFEFRGDNYKGDIWIGVVRINDTIKLPELITKYGLGNIEPKDSWWLSLEKIANDDFLSYLIDKEENNVLRDFVNKFNVLLNDYSAICDKTYQAENQGEAQEVSQTNQGVTK